MKTYILSLSLLSCTFMAFGQEEKKTTNKFQDPVLKEIYTLGNERNSQGLQTFLQHANPQYRLEAATFYASMHDSSALPALYPLLNDPVPLVRRNTAFAIGQMRKSSAVPYLIKHFEQEKDAEVRRYLLEAIGQSANLEALTFLVNTQAPDSLTQVGLAWALNRATKNKIYNQAGSDLAAQFLGLSYPDEARQAAAYYFSQIEDVKGYEEVMIQTALYDPVVDVRLGILRGLRRVQAPEAREALAQLIRQSADYRLRVDAIQAIRQFKTPEVAKIIWEKALQDPHISVRIAAAEALPFQVGPGDLIRLLDGMQASKSMRVKQLFLAAAQQVAPQDDRVLQATRHLFDQKMHALERQEVLNILAAQPGNWRFVAASVLAPQHEEIKSALLNTLRRLRQHKDFPLADTNAYQQMMLQWAQSSDKDRVKEAFRTLAKDEQSKTTLQKSYQKWQSGEDAAFAQELALLLEGNAPQRASMGNRAEVQYRTFDWKDIEKIPVDQKVKITTTKGSFILQTLVEEAPFTVAHFLELAEKGAFNDLAFYRVIPNFVNQTGGTPHAQFEALANMLIRSEFKPRPHRYMTVNFGSHGPDTESSHWSIMLRSTPWNDYNYTVFARVIEGEDVVHLLELGDEIRKIELL